MTKKERILVITVILTLLIMIACYASIIINNKHSKENLVLKTNNGTVTLYKGDRIIEIYEDINVNNLTDYDRKLLKKGIIINNDSELLAILEDYD